MKINILGAGFYGCHIALSLIRDGHNVTIYEKRDHIFAGASGNIPARLHAGFHYPRSELTRTACKAHFKDFMNVYGALTHSVKCNIYAIANHDSLVDFGTYKKVLDGQFQFIEIDRPFEFGLKNVEGAILTGERHIITEKAKKFFEEMLLNNVVFNADINSIKDSCDLTIDCSFCSNDNINIDRFEPCLVLLMKGPIDTAVTIMDGPFPSLYPWSYEKSLCSLSSALYTPFSKHCTTYQQAQQILDNVDADKQAKLMINSMAKFYPDIRKFELVSKRFSIRAMPKSSADTRLIDVVQINKNILRIRAGKIDAVIQAEEDVKNYIGGM